MFYRKLAKVLFGRRQESRFDDKCSGKVNIVDGTKKKSASLKVMQRDVGDEGEEEEDEEVQVDKQGGRRE